MLCPLHISLLFNVANVQKVLLHALRKKVQPLAVNRVQQKGEIQQRNREEAL